MPRNLILPFILLLSLTACDQSSVSTLALQGDGIRGGTEVEPKSSLARQVFQIIIRHSPSERLVDGKMMPFQKSLTCTASALTNRILITAAHCLPESTVSGYVDVTRPDGTLTRVNMIQYQRHPHYVIRPVEVRGSGETMGRAEGPDLALILLETALPEEVGFVTLPPKGVDMRIKKIIASGYGRTTSLSGEGAGILRTTQLSVLGYDHLDEIFTVDQSQGSGGCIGDSGGSAIFKADGINYVVGVFSQVVTRTQKDIRSIEACADKGIYTNVAYNLDWIHSMLKHWKNE